jgi:WD40 repeat protein
MALSPDGRFLVTGTGYQSGLLQVWNAHTGERVATLEGHTEWVCQLTFSRDGQWLASAASDQAVRLWKTATWESAEPLRANSDEVHSIAFSPDGALLASGSKDGVVMLWDLRAPRATGGSVALPAHVQSVRALPGGRAVVAMSSLHGLSRIDLETLSETPLLPEPSARANFTSPKYLGIYDGADRLAVYEIRDAEERLLGNCRVGPAFQFTFVYSPAKRQVAWCEEADGVRIGNLDDGPRIELHSEGEGRTLATRFSSDGKFVMAVDQSGAPAIWEIATRRRVPAAERYLSPHGFTLNSYNSVRGSGLSAWLAAAVSPAITGRSLAPEPAVEKGFWPSKAPTCRAFSVDGHTSAVSAESGMVGLYDAARPEWHARLHGQLHSVFGVAFSADGRRLVSTGDDAEAVKLWDVDTQQELLTLPGHGTFFDGAEFTDDDTTLIIGSDKKQGEWQFWRAPSFAEIDEVERAHGGWARGN